MKLLRLASLCALAYANHISASIENSVPSTVTPESIFVRAGKQSISLQIPIALSIGVLSLEKNIIRSLVNSQDYLTATIFTAGQCREIKQLATAPHIDDIKAFYNEIDPKIHEIAKDLNLQSKLGEGTENTIYTIAPIAGCSGLFHAGSNLIGAPFTIQQSVAACTLLHLGFLASIYAKENDSIQSIRDYIDKK